MQALSPFTAFWTSRPLTWANTRSFPSFNSCLKALRTVARVTPKIVAISSCEWPVATSDRQKFRCSFVGMNGGRPRFAVAIGKLPHSNELVRLQTEFPSIRRGERDAEFRRLLVGR